MTALYLIHELVNPWKTPISFFFVSMLFDGVLFIALTGA